MIRETPTVAALKYVKGVHRVCEFTWIKAHAQQMLGIIAAFSGDHAIVEERKEVHGMVGPKRIYELWQSGEIFGCFCLHDTLRVAKRVQLTVKLYPANRKPCIRLRISPSNVELLLHRLSFE